MPAITPPRLKIQVSELVQNAPEPDVFCGSFHGFLDIYADRTHRPGRVGEPPPLLRGYQVPKPVMKAVDKELGSWAGNNRDKALNLADALWQEPFLEFRLAAASLLGQIEPKPVKPIVGRVETWIQPNTEERLVNALINKGLERILSESLVLYTTQVDAWLRSRKLERNRLGLKACIPLIRRKEFEDYPLLFNRIDRLMRSKNSPLRNDILTVLEEMANQTPGETAFFLENVMESAADNGQIAWYVRKCLDHFPADNRARLREVLVA